MVRLLALLSVLLSGCISQEWMQDQVDLHNYRIRTTVTEMCDMTRTVMPKGYEMPARGYYQNNVKARCVAKDGSVRILTFNELGKLIEVEPETK